MEMTNTDHDLTFAEFGEACRDGVLVGGCDQGAPHPGWP